jgi:hypothetical protein
MNPRKITYFLSLLLSINAVILEAATPPSFIPGSSYDEHDLVILDGKTYQALQSHTNSQDPSTSNAWESLDAIASGFDNPGVEPDFTPDEGAVLDLSAPSVTNATTIKLQGISTNATVTPTAWMVAGVTITGGTKKVVFQVQATGTYPSTDGYLSDPILIVTNSAGAIIATVDNWQDGPNAGYDSTLYSPSYLTELQNSNYKMAGDKECAIVMNLPEGSYTALVNDVNSKQTAKAVVAAFDFE